MLSRCERSIEYITRKRGNCECIATWGRTSHASLSRFNYDAMPSLKLLNLSIAALQRFCYWYITLRYDLDLDLWHLTLNICSVYHMWRDETLYQILTQSSNLRRSYCDFSVWPYDLNIALQSVAIGSGIIFIKFAMLIRYAVTLTFDLLTLNFYSTSGVMCLNYVQNLSEIK